MFSLDRFDQLRDLLRWDGFAVGRKHAATLMKKMRIVALYKKPNSPTPATGVRRI